MPRHLSLVAYNTPPTPASQDHSSCETFASAPLRLNSPLFHSHVRPPISSRATPRLPPSAIFMASLACESLVNGSNVLSSIAKRAAVSPYHSPSTRSTCSARPTLCALCASALKSPNPPIRQSVNLSISHDPPLHALHVLHGQTPLRLCVKIPHPPNPSIPPKFGIIPFVRLKA